MKTLIFNGSPREDGDTAMLIDVFTSHLEGERKIINVFDCNITSCNDCRYCWTNKGCSIQDEMQEVYDYIQDCDNILIASPIFFSELTGQLLVVTSRLQTYFCARSLRNETPIDKPKKGWCDSCARRNVHRGKSGGDGDHASQDNECDSACISDFLPGYRSYSTDKKY